MKKPAEAVGIEISRTEMDEKRLLELAMKGIEMEYVRMNSEMAEVMGKLRKFEKKEKTEEAVIETVPLKKTIRAKKRRRMTAAQKRAISKAQKARWAKTS